MTLKGIDVSGWQKGINLSAVPADFVIIKATGGTSFVNPECDAQFRGARAAGKRTGVYHFAHEVGCPGSAVAEADHFVDSIQGYLDGKTLLVLDFEGDNQFDPQWALTWLNRVRDLTGVKPMIYLNGAALQGADWSAVRAADYGVWLAWYAVSTPTSGYQNYNGANIEDVTPPFPCAMWQFSSTARLPGYGAALDVNVFYGDSNSWDAYCRQSGSGPTSGVAAIGPQSSTITPQEDTLSAAEVKEIKDYLGALLVYGYNSGGVKHPGIAAVVEQNQRDIRATAANVAAKPAVTIDAKALAEEIAKLIPTNQAHDFIVALGQALPKE